MGAMIDATVFQGLILPWSQISSQIYYFLNDIPAEVVLLWDYVMSSMAQQLHRVAVDVTLRRILHSWI